MLQGERQPVWLEERIELDLLEVSIQQPMDLLADTDLRYALTTYQAENLHRSILFTSTTDVYVSPDEIGAWLDVIEKKGLLGGGNTRLRVLDDSIFYNEQEIDGLPTVSNPSRFWIYFRRAECVGKPRRNLLTRTAVSTSDRETGSDFVWEEVILSRHSKRR